MGAGNHKSSLLNNHHQRLLRRRREREQVSVPKGCLAIKVGGEGAEQHRFVVPLMYFRHPLFLQLLKEAEEEYGFDQKGAIAIPCHVDDFLFVQRRIDRERPRQHPHHSHLPSCFRVSHILL